MSANLVFTDRTPDFAVSDGVFPEFALKAEVFRILPRLGAWIC
jgi:hypothetical protein